MNKNLLLIDADTRLTSELSAYLTQHQFDVECADNGDQGLKMALNKPFDAVISEIILPDYNGLQILKSVREHLNLPILFLTGYLDAACALVALKCGADDYLNKPCDINELLLRVQNIMHRSKHHASTHLAPIHYQYLALDCNKREFRVHDQLLELTNTEFNILEILMKSPGQAFSKEDLTEYALGRKFTAYDRSIDVHISNLRNKLGTNHNNEPWIHTVRGFGYQFNA
jgi:two-component system response regulator CpxR